MKLLSFLFPQTIEEINSPLNGKIKIVKFWNNYSIHVAGLSQSGSLVKNLWESGLKELQTTNYPLRTCLVLGVGGGTIIQLINKYYPHAKITGIEIDPLMTKLGQKYFNLDNAKNVNIIISDVINWVKKNNTKKFDLILIDLYIGKNIPPQLTHKSFIKDLKNILNTNGVVIINRLRNKDNKLEIEEYIKKLKQEFSTVLVQTPIINHLIFCWK